MVNKDNTHCVVEEFQEVALAVLDENIPVGIGAVTQSPPYAEACVPGLQRLDESLVGAESLADGRADGC